MHFEPRPYQRTAISWLLEKPFSGLFADPGMGKTAIALSVIDILKRLRPNYKALVIAPLAICRNVWPDEIEQWDRFRNLRLELLHGPEKAEAIQRRADLYVINPNGLPWLFETLPTITRRFPFFHLFLDESTVFRNQKGKRYRRLRKYLRRFKRRTILTGTPIPRSIEDLYGQLFMMDRGLSFGKTIGPFRETYFTPKNMRFGDRKFTQWTAKPDAIERIEKRIAPRILRLDAAEELGAKDPHLNPVYVRLPGPIQEIYDNIEKHFYAEIEGENVFVPTAVSLYGALRQIASGGLYKPLELLEIPKNRKIYNLHSAKAEALRHIIHESWGKPVLIGYFHRFIVPHLNEFFGYEIPAINGDTKPERATELIREWNSGKLPLLLGQPQSMGHGLNLHKGPGRSIVWVNLIDDYEKFDQLNRRIHRSGVNAIVHILLARNTVDEVIYSRFIERDETQRTLLAALKKYLKRKHG